MEDKDVTEICVNRPKEVFVEKFGQWNKCRFQELLNIVSRLLCNGKFVNNDVCETRRFFPLFFLVVNEFKLCNRQPVT
jgi:hypothetical protein